MLIKLSNSDVQSVEVGRIELVDIWVAIAHDDDRAAVRRDGRTPRQLRQLDATNEAVPRVEEVH